MKCGQDKCDAIAVARFTWPGREEKGICSAHLPKLRATASALGLRLQIIPLLDDEDDGPSTEPAP